jgi:hypothetical protein
MSEECNWRKGREIADKMKKDGYFPADWADTLIPIAAKVPCPGHVFKKKELEAMEKPEFFAELLAAKISQIRGDLEPAKKFAEKYEVGEEVVVKCGQPHIYYDQEPLRRFIVEKGYVKESESKEKCIVDSTQMFWLARHPELEDEYGNPKEGVKRVKPT